MAETARTTPRKSAAGKRSAAKARKGDAPAAGEDVDYVARRREDLEDLRESLRARIESRLPEDNLAAISKELRAVNAELVELAPPTEGDPVRDLEDRRASRRASSAAPRRSARRS